MEVVLPVKNQPCHTWRVTAFLAVCRFLKLASFFVGMGRYLVGMPIITGFGNYLMTIGVVETVALFVMVFIQAAL